MVASMEEIYPGLWHCTARHPRLGIHVSSYFVPQHGLLLDPLLPPEGIERLDELARPREILLTNRHHWRDCGKLVQRFGCTVRAPRTGMHEFHEGQPVTPYDFGESLVGGAVTVHEVGVLCPDESALHIPSVSALAVADGVTHYGELDFVSDDLMDDPEDTKAGLKAAYARLAEGLEFENLLTAHGNPLVGGAREALRDWATRA